MRANLKVLRNFYNYPAAQMVTFGYNIAANLDPALFLNLPVPPATLVTLTDTLNTAVQATLAGGRMNTAAKNTAFTALANALNSDANIVENTVGMNLEMLLATGYLPVSTTRSSAPLDDTAIAALMNNGTTQALLRLQPVVNAKAYQVQTSLDGGTTWVEATLSSQARRIVLTGLVPGKTYAVRARAICGSTGASSWTLSQSIMST
jgi:Fibronectin type III domain